MKRRKIKKEGSSTSERLHKSADTNKSAIKKALHGSSDLIIKESGDYVTFYIESLVDRQQIRKHILPYLLAEKPDIKPVIYDSAGELETIDQAVKKLLSGAFIWFDINNAKKIYSMEVTKSYDRTVEEPENEKVIRGSHEGFVESLMININLIRKRIEHPSLTVRYSTLGEKSKTKLAVVYMDGLADPDVVARINKRLADISIDMVMSPGFIEEFVEQSALSPFPQMLNTERPDRVMAHLMEGRVALVTEGSPTVLIIPITFFAFYQSPDDYNSCWISGTYVRLIRIISFIIAVGLPSYYISIIGFHFEVIPDDLILPIKGSVTNIAYSPIEEALVMVLTIELIREAGIRLPTPIGQTIGIVGGLVIGDAVVQAGLISNLMVIIVALTAISSFVVPSNEMSTSLRILTYPMMIMATTFGFVGVTFGFMIMIIHLCKLESFGTPYLAPVAPLHFKDLKDTFVRLPLWMFNSRPKDAQPQAAKRQSKTSE
ncbi:spore germination protein [Virgibacillus flavescens]|uniref:spore germination protein n=1 Tax=Virgibacillus flavescens TaxID=1611422 RepID=UPI003D34EF7E